MKKHKFWFEINSSHYWKLHVLEWMQNVEEDSASFYKLLQKYKKWRN